MAFLELKLPPLLILLLCAGVMWAGALWFPSWQWRGPVWFSVGVAASFAVAGTLVALNGVWAFRRHQTTVDPTDPAKASQLVDSGIYARSRNPMYLGFALLLMGWGALLFNPVALVGVGVFVLYLNRFQIQPEEQVLKTVFGQAYEDYCTKVRRWM